MHIELQMHQMLSFMWTIYKRYELNKSRSTILPTINKYYNTYNTLF